jgi:hypothetical protein
MIADEGLRRRENGRGKQAVDKATEIKQVEVVEDSEQGET